MYSVFEQGQWYCMRQLHRYDFVRQSAYQRLRAEIFVKQLGWEIPVDARGRERDHYDEMSEDRVQASCVYGKGNKKGAECLLGGVRTLILKNWDDSMTVNEFQHVDMVPASIIDLLKDRYDPTDLLEITRLCLRRGHIYEPRWDVAGYGASRFDLGVARDLVFANVYALVEQTGRKLALGIADQYYLRVMQRSHFVFEELYSHHTSGRRGYSLTMIDLPATIFAMEEAGAYDRIQRMLSLCSQPITV
jgi:N-acyl-L-homoserine lactone synthetase